MTLIFDTSIVIDLDNRYTETIRKIEELKKVYQSVPKISFITYFEFIHGLRKRNPKNKQKSIAFIELFNTLQTTKNTAVILSQFKTNYGDLPLADLLIAAQTFENNLVLVTKDKDFSQIKELNSVII